MTHETKNPIEKAREQAAQIIAKAEAEQAALDMLPDIGVPVSIMIFRDCPHVRYAPESFADVLRIVDAFQTVPAFDCKDKGSRGTYAETRGEELGEYFAWVDMSGGVGTGSSAKFRFFAKLEDGRTAQVSAEFEDSTWARKYQNRAWHDDLRTGFTNMKPRAVIHKEYQASGPLFLAQAAQVVSYATGDRQGGSAHYKGYFATRDCLAYALETLEPRDGESAQ